MIVLVFGIIMALGAAAWAFLSICFLRDSLKAHGKSDYWRGMLKTIGSAILTLYLTFIAFVDILVWVKP